MDKKKTYQKHFFFHQMANAYHSTHAQADLLFEFFGKEMYQKNHIVEDQAY